MYIHVMSITCAIGSCNAVVLWTDEAMLELASHSMHTSYVCHAQADVALSANVVL